VEDQTTIENSINQRINLFQDNQQNKLVFKIQLKKKR
jgi:hypothetical protein